MLAQRLREQQETETYSHMLGRLGWFQLRLTARELRDLVGSAQSHGVIAPVTHAPTGHRLPEPTWALSTEGRSLPRPRGGSYKDMRHQAGAAVRRAWGFSKTLLAITGLVLTTGLGLTVKDGSLLANILLVVGGWGIFLSLAATAVDAERGLTACAASWPRLERYRPRRAEFQRLRLRAPGTPCLFAAATLAAVAIIALRLHHEDEIATSTWHAITVVAAIGLAIDLLTLLVLLRRAAGPRRAYRAENERRRPPGERRGRLPQPAVLPSPDA